MRGMKWKAEEKENPLFKSTALYESALGEFAQKSFNEASLNDMLKTSKINKGSFYYRFYDKTDLYLSMLHKMGIDKMSYLKEKGVSTVYSSDFFAQLKMLITTGLFYKEKEQRYFDIWRRYLTEDTAIHNLVKTNFKEQAQDSIAMLVSFATLKGQIKNELSEQTVLFATRLIIENIDELITDSSHDEEILKKADEVISLLKWGMAI